MILLNFKMPKIHKMKMKIYIWNQNLKLLIANKIKNKQMMLSLKKKNKITKIQKLTINRKINIQMSKIHKQMTQIVLLKIYLKTTNLSVSLLQPQNLCH